MKVTWNDYIGRTPGPTGSGRRTQEPIVWHYTSVDVFEQIIANHAIWATDVGYLNDTDEIRLGVKRFKKRLEQAAEPAFSLSDQDNALDFKPVQELISSWEDYPFDGSAFVISFSRYGDDNSQWERYGHGAQGVAIGIRRGAHMPVLGTAPGFGGTSVIEDVPNYWTNMLYKRREQDDVLDRATGVIRDGLTQNPSPEAGVDLSGLFKDQALSEYGRAVAKVKNVGFRAEKEVRYVVSRPGNPDVIHTRDDRTDPTKKVPFVKVTGAPASAASETDPRWLPQYQETPLLLPIAKVRLGPKNTVDVMEVEDLLASSGYGNSIRVVRSKSTLR